MPSNTRLTEAELTELERREASSAWNNGDWDHATISRLIAAARLANEQAEKQSVFDSAAWAENGALRKQLAEHDATIESLRAERDAARRAFESCRKYKVHERGEQWVSLQEQIAERDATIERLRAELAENRRMHDIHDEVEAISNRRVAELEKAAAEHEQYRALVVEEFADYERKLTKARELIAEMLWAWDGVNPAKSKESKWQRRYADLAK